MTLSTIRRSMGFDYKIRETINFKKQDKTLIKKFINKNENDKELEEKELSLNNIVGLNSVKEELRYYLDFIKNRDKYKKWNVKLPKGILLIGPPGTGKTLLVKTLAKEIELPVINASGSEFVEMYVGVGASRVRKLFSRARSHKNGCIIFIDEIDAIGKKRSGVNEGNSERDNTLNQLLVEIDGFGGEDNVMVFGATNLVKNLDSALTRSGRFDKKVYFDPPNKEERVKLFELYLKDIPINSDIEIDKLGELTSGLNGADIANICNQSKINAIQEYIKNNTDSDNDKEDDEDNDKEDDEDNEDNEDNEDKYKEDTQDNKNKENNKNKEEITMDNIQKAIDEVMIGREKPERKMEKEERERVAHHEAGHAIMSYILKDSNHPIKVSILPRGENALGFSQPKPEDRKLYTQNFLLAQMCVLLGGRVAEKIIYGNYSSGAHDDIERVTNLVKHWFLTWGMDTSSGALNYYELSNRKIPDEMINKVKIFIKDVEKFTFNVLYSNKDHICSLAKLLLDKETIIYTDINNLLPKELENKIQNIEI
jgi:cell division protease FtsH